MNRSLVRFIAVVVVAVATAVASAQSRGPAKSQPPSFGPQQSLSGTVVQFVAGPGVGMPSLVVSAENAEKTFVLGPFWYLDAAKFTAAAGDRVIVTTLACSACPSSFAVIAVQNLSSGTEIRLRDGNGVPLWNAGGPGNPGTAGPGAGRGGMGMGGCRGLYGAPDMARSITVDGTVSSFSGGPGIGRPELTLSTSSGSQTFIVGPYRVLLDAGYSFVPGAKIVLTAAPAGASGVEEWVVLKFKDVASGLEFALRDPATGLPLGDHHGYRP